MLEALGGPEERRWSAEAAGFGEARAADLNVLAIEVAAGPAARVLPLGGGLDDGLFEHDGQMTKRAVRAMTLAALAPRRGELLLDIGAGAGSVAIEWMLRHPSLRAVAVEARARPGGADPGATPPRSACRACGWSRGRRRRRSTGWSRRTRCFSAAAGPIRGCSTRPSGCCGRAGGWWRTR